MKRSTNFRGRPGKRLTPRGLMETMRFVGMSEDEQRKTLLRIAGCTCGPNDKCSVCALASTGASWEER